MDGGRKIIDVRSEFEFMIGRVEGSINIPLEEIPNHLEEIKGMDNPLLCCASGHRSGEAVNFLKSNGIQCENGGGWREVKKRIEINSTDKEK